jgi:hypothetical protein
MRLRGGAYYKKPFPILGKSAAKPADPQMPPPTTTNTGGSK